jgi:transposase
MSPLSLDLRHRIIRAWQEEKVTILELAERFSVGSATVKRLVWRFRKTGRSSRFLKLARREAASMRTARYPVWEVALVAPEPT